MHRTSVSFPALVCVLTTWLGCTADPSTTPGDASSSDEGTTEAPGSESSTAAAVSSSDAGDPTTSTGAASSSSGEDSTSAGPIVAACDDIDPVVLYSSTANVGVPPGSFLGALSSWWDPETGDFDESADDIVVPDGSCWCITSVAVLGRYRLGDGPAKPEFVVNFYDDAGELPNERWFSETLGASSVDRLDAVDDRYGFDLEQTAVAPAGRSWMSVVEVVQDQERFGIALSLDPSRTLSAAHFDLSDCGEFLHFEDCYPGEPAVQLAIEVLGAEVPCDP